jgi:hypothetical protein
MSKKLERFINKKLFS